MSYLYVATSVAGFIQQLAVGYIATGHYYYVSGTIPVRCYVAKTDRKIVEQYDIALSKWTRSRRKRQGMANVHYLRYQRFFVIIASDGLHPFFAAEAKGLQDIRLCPLQFMGYSIGCRRARGGGEYHASVRINRERFAELKARFQEVAVHRSVKELSADLLHLPFEPYAPVRVQLLGLLRDINRRRKLAALELVPYSALRLHRRPVRPFEERKDLSESAVRFESPNSTEQEETKLPGKK